MSDQENPTEESGAVRRVGRKDRKAKIERRGKLFPEEEGRESGEDSAWMPPESADTDAAEEDERSAVVEAPPESGAESPRDSRPRRGRFPPMPDELERLERRAAAQRAAAQPDPRRAAQNAQLNQITAILLLLTILIGGYIGVLWIDPYSPLNLFAPPTPLPILVSMTPTPSPTLTPTFTLTPSPTLTPSLTPTPSETPSPVPSATFTPIPPEALGITALPGAPDGTALEPEGGFPFRLIPAGLIYIANPDARGGCNWSSIVGSVVDTNGRAVDGYIVRIQGEGVDEAVITGTARGFGAGGYELPLGSQAREAVYTVTLFDSTGQQVAAPVTAITRADCANITAVRFIGQ
jgi:hypothetical protein